MTHRPSFPTTTVLIVAAALLLAQFPGISQETVPEEPSNGNARPTVGLALSGGGALGFAHVGVLLELAERGIPVDYVAGTSMGSVVGGLFAAGYTAEEILELTKTTDWNSLFSDQPPWRTLPYDRRRADALYSVTLGFQNLQPLLGSGVTTGQNVVELLDDVLSQYATSGSFDRLPRPLRVVATNLETGEEAAFSDGDLKTAIRASLAVPGAFTPVEYNGTLYVDGGLVNRLPVDQVATFEPDHIIAVRLGTLSAASELTSVTDVVDQSAQILRTKQVSESINLADLVITPDVESYTGASFDAALELVERGREAARSAAESLDELAKTLAGERESHTTGTNPESGTRAVPNPDEEQELAVAEVRFPSDVPSLRIQSEVTATLEGRTTTHEIREVVYDLYDSGRYRFVTYTLEEVEPAEDSEEADHPESQYALNVHLGLEARRTSQLRAGFAFESDLWAGVAPGFTTPWNLLLFDALIPNLRIGAHLWLGEGLSAAAQLRYPLADATAVTAAAYSVARTVRFFEDRLPSSVYALNTTGFRLGAVTVVRDSAELWIDGVAEWDAATLRTGTPLSVGESTWRFGADLAARAETIDAYPFPRIGSRTDVAYRARYTPGRNSFYNTAEMAQRWYAPILDASAIMLGGRVATDFTSGMPRLEHFAIGGQRSFHGLHTGEEKGNHLLALAAKVRIRVLKLPFLTGESLYAVSRVDVGTAWSGEYRDIVQDSSIVTSLSLGVAAETVLGGAELTVGVTLDGRFAAGLRIGNEMGFPGTLESAR